MTEEYQTPDYPLSAPRTTYPAPTFWQHDSRWKKLVKKLIKGH